MSINVSWQNGLGNNGEYFGWQNLQQSTVQDLQRAIDAGTANPGFGGGSAHQIQNLDATLRVSTFTNKSIYAFGMIPKVKATATTYEYGLLKDWGGEGDLFVNGGELPQLDDALYLRAHKQLKYMAIQKEIKDPLMRISAAYEPMVTRETKNGVNRMTESIERSLFFGNQDIVPQEWDGMTAQFFADPDFVAEHVTDLRGNDIREDHVEEGANRVIESHGTPHLMFMQPHNLSRLSADYFTRQRSMLPPTANNTVGFQVLRQQTSAGIIDFCASIHLRAGRRGGRKLASSTATSPLAPAAPSAVTGTAGAGTSLFTTATAGDYWYGACAVNRFGRSAVTMAAAATTIAATEQVVVACTSADPTTEGYIIFRSKRNPANAAEALATAQEVRRISKYEDYLDEDYLLPGMGMNWMIMNSNINWFMAILAPLLRIDLGRIALAERWVQIFYATPIFPIPQFNHVFINAPDSNTLGRD